MLMGVSVSRARKFTTVQMALKSMKGDANRGHHQSIIDLRTAKDRHNYGRTVFPINK